MFPEAVASMSRALSLEFDDEDFLPATEVCFSQIRACSPRNAQQMQWMD